jgi:CRISPR/Cas system-associated endonuclease Cas1
MTTLAHRSATAAQQPSRKPLYLVGPAPARVDAGADHLVLHKGAGCPMRFPLARVCRIICTRHLTWTGAALSLCLSHGVPITWVDGHGHTLGTTQSHYAQPLPF